MSIAAPQNKPLLIANKDFIPYLVDGLLLDSNTVAQCQGNCVGMTSGTGMQLRNSVFLRDAGTRLFMYGVTDVIIGTVTGDNVIEDCDFHARGEFEGGPDGCAVDFETSASGHLVCPEESPDYLPPCRQAGRIVMRRCLDEGVGERECEGRAELARRHAMEAGKDYVATIENGSAREWLDAQDYTWEQQGAKQGLLGGGPARAG